MSESNSPEISLKSSPLGNLRERYEKVRPIVKHVVKNRPKQKNETTQERQALQRGAFLAAEARQPEIDQIETERKKAEEEAMIDGLTGLYTRKAFYARLPELVALARRNGPLSVALIDIDDFKGVNDAYGHQAGDETLRVVAQVVMDSIRASDFAARYGGEEFVVLMSVTPEDGATKRIDKIREDTSAKVREALAAKGITLFKDITFSAGIAQLPTDIPKSVQDIADITAKTVGDADRRLYLAKHAGKNTVFDSSRESLM